MKIGVLETGMVGKAIASKPVAPGRDVMMGVPHRQHRSRAPAEVTRLASHARAAPGAIDLSSTRRPSIRRTLGSKALRTSGRGITSRTSSRASA